jgi:hypothetical protein
MSLLAVLHASSRVMTAVATERQGNKMLDRSAAQPANAVPVGLHLRHISVDALQKRARQGGHDDDKEDVKLREARHNLNWW